MRGLFGSRFHRSENSFSLRLNGFTKICLCTVVSIITLIMGDAGSLSLLLFGSFVFAITQIRLKILAIVYLMVAVMSGISIGFAQILVWGFSFFAPGMGDYSIFSMLLPFMRILIVLQTVVVTALSTSPQEILINLKSIKLPRVLYLPIIVMLRFIPTFINDLRQINESLKTRGLRITPLSIIIHPILTMRCSVFPLIFRALRSSDELAIASELKGVGYSKKVTSFKKHHFRIEDAVMVLLMILFFTCSSLVFLEAPQKKSSRTRQHIQTGKENIHTALRWVLNGGMEVSCDEQQLYMQAFEKPKKRTHGGRKK